MEQMIFASKLKELRKRQGMSQEQLAEAVGLSVQAVSKWECALSWPDITLLPVISQLFGVSIDHLLSNHIAENTHGPAFTAETFPFADDGVLRIVQYKGRKLCSKRNILRIWRFPWHGGRKIAQRRKCGWKFGGAPISEEMFRGMLRPEPILYVPMSAVTCRQTAPYNAEISMEMYRQTDASPVSKLTVTSTQTAVFPAPMFKEIYVRAAV